MNTAAMRLDEYAFLQVEGARTLQFLQGQLTCNVQDAGPGKVLPGACCTPKGRVISSFLLWARAPDSVLLRMRADIADSTAEMLGKYGALSRVRVGRAPLACIGLAGPGLEQRAGDLVAAWPQALHAASVAGERCLVRRDTTGERFELWVPGTEADQLWQDLGARLGSADSARWRLELVRAGEAELQAATSDAFLPQMLGYDTSGAVSFRKGCYTGQEIIARTHYKGSVKRRLRHLGGSGTQCPAPGSELLLGEGGRGVGTVVESTMDGDCRFELLAVIADEALQGERCLAVTAHGAVLEVLPLAGTAP